MALPVVLTGSAASGIDATPGEHFAVAESDVDIAEAVVALAQNAARARVMGEAARNFVVEKQSWQSALVPLAAMIARLPEAQPLSFARAGTICHAA